MPKKRAVMFSDAQPRDREERDDDQAAEKNFPYFYHVKSVSRKERFHAYF
jgi:hypothetical protein